jgi:hypothetical protein
MLSRTLESGVNALPLGKTNFPCRFSVTRTLVLGCLSNNALALQGFKEVILKHHERFTDKTLNHITYIDKKLWDSPDGVLKQFYSPLTQHD